MWIAEWASHGEQLHSNTFDQFSIAQRSSGSVIHSRLPIFINAVFFSLFFLFVVAF